MRADVLEKAFEPFFTTKASGAGTGLGLASVANFARQAGGFAFIESAPGQGCAVSIYLRRSTAELPARRVSSSEGLLGRGELILVVEDDDAVREVTLKRLELLGYAAIEARTGPEAIERLNAQDGVRLVLSDIVMPGGMTGYDVARWTASNKPDIKIVLCSGYNEGDRGAGTDGATRAFAILGKPYTRDRLAGVLAKALAS